MKQKRKMINLLAAFVIAIGGAFLVLPETSYAATCTVTVECGGNVVCTCSGSTCAGDSAGCSSSSNEGTAVCYCNDHEQ